VYRIREYRWKIQKILFSNRVRKAITSKNEQIIYCSKDFGLSDCIENSVMKISTDNEFKEIVIV
jgi:phage pi2 protein 07